MPRALPVIRWLLPVLLLLVGAAHARDSRVTVDAAVDPPEMHIGDSLVYVVQVTGAREVAPPDLSALKADFEISGPSVQYSTRSENFRTSVAAQFRYVLTPRRHGKFVLPPPKVTVNDHEYAGPQHEVNVLPPEDQDVAILELEAKPRRVYAGQPFTVTLRVVMKPLAETDREPLQFTEPPVLRMPWLKEPPADVRALQEKNDILGPILVQTRRSGDARGFELEGFVFQGGFFSEKAVVRPDPKRVARTDKTGKQLSYFVYEIETQYASDKPGTYAFGPALLNGRFIAGVNAGRMIVKRFPVVAPAVEVEVASLDPAAMPPGFSGAIGRFSISATATPLELRVGDPLTLELAVKPAPGSVSLEQVGAPDLTRQEALARDFVVVDEKPIGEVAGGEKRFRYALRPKRAGVQIPALRFPYFDPQAEKYVDAATEPIALKVTEAVALGAQDVVGAPRANDDRGPVQASAGGIHQNVTELRDIRDERADPRLVIAWIAGLAVFYAALSTFVVRRRRLAGDWARQRRLRALKNARARLDAPDAAAPGPVRAALLGLCADLCHLAEAGLTAREADAALLRAGVSEPVRRELSALLERLEQAAYGGGNALDPQVLDQARALAPRIDAEVRR